MLVTAVNGSEKREPIAPILYIAREAWNKIQTYVDGVPVEVNGFGYVSCTERDQFIIWSADDIFITKQVVDASAADNHGGDFAKADYQALMAGRKTELHFQWHSHVWGNTYHSTTDMRTIEIFGHAGMDWFISAVTNKHGEITARLDIYRPFRIGVGLVVHIFEYVDQAMLRQVSDDIEKLVTISKPKVSKSPRARS